MTVIQPNSISGVTSITAQVSDISIFSASSGFANITAGNISAAGTITYEDVTNVDSVGVITARSGINLTGGNITLGDSGGATDDRIVLGAGSDLSIMHDGTESTILSATGGLVIKDTGGYMRIRSDELKIQSVANETYIEADANGAVQLFHNDSKKFETTSGGAEVFGELQMDDANSHIKVPDNARIDFGTGNDLRIYHDGTDNRIDSANNGTLKFQRGGADVFEIKSTGLQGLDSKKVMLGTSDDLQLFHDGTHSYVQGYNTGNLYVGTNHSANLILVTGNSGRWSLSASGHLLPEVNNTYDLGTSSYRVRNIYTNDLHLSNEGSSNDVDGTWGDWTLQEGESDVYMINNRSGKKFRIKMEEV